MKRILIIAFCLFALTASTDAQWFLDAKRDYQWIMGKGDWPPPLYGGFEIDFHTNPLSYIIYEHPLYPRWTNASICDWEGNMVVALDGEKVINKTGQVMKNSENLNLGPIHTLYPDYYPAQSSFLILPHPSNYTNYLIIHQQHYWDPQLLMLSSKLMFSIVDMDLDSGRGAVTEKNVPLITDTLDPYGLAAVRHGNGRDWWILVPEFGQPAYYRLLLDAAGVHYDGKQTIGVASTRAEWGECCFSPDGEWFARCGDSAANKPKRLELYKFDRCTGLLSDYVFLKSEFPYLMVLMGLEFSPNSKFLYVSSGYQLFQFDLQDPDIPASCTQVAAWDSTNYMQFIPIGFLDLQLSPDHKIIFGSGSTPYMHTIEHPDVKGMGCEVIQRSLTMPKVTFNVPRFPNFRLGPKAGSSCDSIYHAGYEDLEKTNHISAYPNPASDVVHFELELSINNKPMQFTIFDVPGKLLDVLEVSPYQGLINYDVSDLQPGMYLGVLKQGRKTITRIKFLVE